MTTIEELIADARPKTSEDHHTDRQLDASNAVWTELSHRWPEEFGEDAPFSTWCLKATEEEMLDAALSKLGDRVGLEVETSAHIATPSHGI